MSHGAELADAQLIRANGKRYSGGSNESDQKGSCD